jgi:hypothetical protein
MFRSPSISKLMHWHLENRSDQEGGDNLVWHPSDSKAWHHFHKHMDPTFGGDPWNAHFALVADVSTLSSKLDPRGLRGL